jgi:hypothetical protein
MSLDTARVFPCPPAGKGRIENKGLRPVFSRVRRATIRQRISEREYLAMLDAEAEFERTRRCQEFAIAYNLLTASHRDTEFLFKLSPVFSLNTLQAESPNR